MEQAEYENALTWAHYIRISAEQLGQAHDLDEMLAAIGRADALGSVVDPTNYLARREKMVEDRKTIEAVVALARLAPAGEEGTNDGN